jgi:hypothetical protein
LHRLGDALVSEAAIIDPRTRALAFAAATLVVTLACALLLLMSRIIQYADDNVLGVRVLLEEAPRSPPGPRRAPPPQPQDAPVGAHAAATPTPLPIDRAVRARALACFDRLNRERAPDCPVEALESEHGDRERSRRAYDPSPPRINPAITPPMGVDPPCVPGLNGANVCIRFGIRPPPPSRSAEEICVAGGVGPCHPPPFREEAVVRLPHTR